MTMKTIIQDTRPIAELWLIGRKSPTVIVGFGVTRIVAYHENGQCAHVVWFAVYADDNIIGRINGAGVSRIVYASEPEETTA